VEEERKSDAAGHPWGANESSGSRKLDGFSSLFLFLAHFWTRLLFFFSIGWGGRERAPFVSGISKWYMQNATDLF
jgi:hypothetical protein